MLRSVLASLFVLTLALPAVAGEVPFSGSLAIQFGESGAILPGAGAVPISPALLSGDALRSFAADPGQAEAVEVPAGAFVADGVVIPIDDMAVYPIAGIYLNGRNAQGNFEGAPLAGQLPLEGEARLCLFGPCESAIANLTIPLDAIGEHGAVYKNVLGMNMTVVGAPWTTGTAQIGAAQQTGSATGAGGSLVTPVFISTNLPATPLLPGFGILRFFRD